MVKNRQNPQLMWRSGSDRTVAFQVCNICLPFAVLQLDIGCGIICGSRWQLTSQSSIKLYRPEENSDLLESVAALLQQPGAHCALPLLQQGSQFRLRVWDAMCRIPYGQTITYKTLAQWTESSPRAVANACRENPFSGIIPCHRVVAVNGPGGFMGHREGPWLTLKQKLLVYEASRQK